MISSKEFDRAFKHKIERDKMKEKLKTKPTKNMQAFMDANKEDIVAVGARTKEGICYSLKSGEEFRLPFEDIESAPDFTALWRFNK